MRRTCYFVISLVCLTVLLVSLASIVQAEQAPPAADQEYSAEQINNTPPDVFLQRMATPEPGYHKFAAMWALTKKAKGADPAARWGMLNLVSKAMHDKSRGIYQRFQCCYVISGVGDDKWVPQLVYVLLNDPAPTMRSVAAEALGSFKNSAAAREGLTQASKQEKDPKVLETIEKNLVQGDAKYTPDQVKSIPTEVFIERLAKPEPGYHKFSAMWALTDKAKGSDEKARKEIMDQVVATMNDTSRVDVQRWECCYIISGVGDEKWVPALADALRNSQTFIVRSVAAEALGQFRNCQAAHNALVNAQSKETDQRVLDVINKVLAKAGAGS